MLGFTAVVSLTRCQAACVGPEVTRTWFCSQQAPPVTSQAPLPSRGRGFRWSPRSWCHGVPDSSSGGCGSGKAGQGLGEGALDDGWQLRGQHSGEGLQPGHSLGYPGKPWELFASGWGTGPKVNSSWWVDPGLEWEVVLWGGGLGGAGDGRGWGSSVSSWPRPEGF